MNSAISVICINYLLLILLVLQVRKKYLMKNKNSEFGMQSSLRTIRKTWCLVDRFCQVGRQQISWLNGLDVFYSCFSNYMAQKITDQRVNKQKHRVGPTEKKPELLILGVKISLTN